MATKVFAKPLDAEVDELQTDIDDLNDIINGGLKVGEIRMFSGSTAPTKWKLCDGSIISRDDYSALFTAIGTAFGGGDGETTFAIPDFQGRSPVGVGESEATGHTAHTLGEYDGEETHVLTGAELASHQHYGYYISLQPGSGSIRYPATDYNSRSGNSGSAVTQATGSNTAHNTMQPYTGINFIIYTGVEEESA